MRQRHRVRVAAQWAGILAGAAALGYGGWAGFTWWRYGRTAAREPFAADPLLDRFMPDYEVVERHKVRVAASADVALAALCDVDVQQSRIVRAIFRARELALGADPDGRERPRGLLAWSRSLGWGLLAEVAGREIVMGAVTQPWNANVVFRPLPPDEFAPFREPGFVKIVWTLRADPLSDGGSIAGTETRVMTTDPAARARFRRYWSFVSPGVVLIRLLALGLVKTDAERRAVTPR